MIQNEQQHLQNFADKFNLQVHKKFTQDKRKKQRYFLVKNGISVSPVFDYHEMNCFLNGIYNSIKHKIQ